MVGWANQSADAANRYLVDTYGFFHECVMRDAGRK